MYNMYCNLSQGRNERKEYMIKCVIFDFDGTLADTARQIMDVYNIIAEKYGYEKHDMDDFHLLKQMNLSTAMQLVDIPIKKMPSLIKEGQKIFKNYVHEVDSFTDNLADILRKIKELCGTVGIISSNTKKNIRIFLEQRGIDCMDFVISSPLFTKETKIKTIMSKYRFFASDVLYVGDETRDVDSARKAGVRSVAVTWGWTGKELLKKHSPDYIIDSFDELLPVIVQAGNE